MLLIESIKTTIFPTLAVFIRSDYNIREKECGSMAKFVFVTGGVVSGLGKGITAASLGRLLKSRGLKVAAQKLDPYINIDPGTMSPYRRGNRPRFRALRTVHRRKSE